MSGHRVYVWRTLESSKDLSTFAGVVADLQKQLPIPGSCDQAVLAFAQRLQSLVRLTPNVDTEFLAAFGDLVNEARESKTSVLLIELPANQHAKAWKVVTETAKLLNLSVFDDDSAELFSTGVITPKVVENKGAVDFHPEDKIELTPEAFKKWASPFIDDEMWRRGYAKQKKIVDGMRCYYKENGECKILVCFTFVRCYSGMLVQVYFSLEHDLVNKVVSNYGFYGPPITFAQTYSVNFEQRDSVAYTYQDFFNMIGVVGIQLLDALGETTSLDKLNNLIHGTENSFLGEKLRRSVFIPQALILAWVSKHERMQDVILELESSDDWGANKKHRDTLWPKLVADVLAGPYNPVEQ